MSYKLLLLFALAMISAVLAKMTPASFGPASIACVCLLISFAVLTRVQGIRKPVV